MPHLLCCGQKPTGPVIVAVTKCDPACDAHISFFEVEAFSLFRSFLRPRYSTRGIDVQPSVGRVKKKRGHIKGSQTATRQGPKIIFLFVLLACPFFSVPHFGPLPWPLHGSSYTSQIAGRSWSTRHPTSQTTGLYVGGQRLSGQYGKDSLEA